MRDSEPARAPCPMIACARGCGVDSTASHGEGLDAGGSRHEKTCSPPPAAPTSVARNWGYSGASSAPSDSALASRGAHPTSWLFPSAIRLPIASCRVWLPVGRRKPAFPMVPKPARLIDYFQNPIRQPPYTDHAAILRGCLDRLPLAHASLPADLVICARTSIHNLPSMFCPSRCGPQPQKSSRQLFSIRMRSPVLGSLVWM